MCIYVYLYLYVKIVRWTAISFLERKEEKKKSDVKRAATETKKKGMVWECFLLVSFIFTLIPGSNPIVFC